MIIKVLGIGRPNKGAELMLLAIKEHFSKKNVVVVDKTLSDGLGQLRRRIGRLIGVSIPAYAEKIVCAFPRSLRLKKGYVFDEDVDVIFDASGFAYGDKWGVEKLRARLASEISVWKRNGKKVIILPQAMGSFTLPGFDLLLKEVVEHADLIFLRDDESYKHLTKIVGERSKIMLKPDFTNLVAVPSLAERFGQVAIIPNSKMLEMNAVSKQEDYVAGLVTAIDRVRSAGKSVFLINHEGDADRRIIEAIQSACDETLFVFESENPAQIKAAIKTAEFIISSRFHGLVSALSQSVPVIATGWTHKYRELLADYGIGEYLIDSDVASMEAAVDRLLVEKEQERVVEILNYHSVRIKRDVEDMWQKIDQLLEC